MKVVICGAGQVGYHLAHYLSKQKYDVSVVDTSSELIAKINDNLEVQAFVGSASFPDVLLKAGADYADLIIAVTLSDEVNMIACQVAHYVFGVPLKIARIRKQNYLDGVDLFSSDKIAIDQIISPEKEVATSLIRRISTYGAFDNISFSDGKIKLIGVHCSEKCSLLNTPLRQLTSVFPDLDMTICAIIRKDKFFVPLSNEEIMLGDDIYFAIRNENIARSMELFGYKQIKDRKVVIIGGGSIAVYIAELLKLKKANYSIHIIEKDPKRARKVAQLLPWVSVINGDALEDEILLEAGISSTDILMTVTDHDEINVLASLLTKKYDIKRTIALINRNGYSSIANLAGIDIVISPKEVTASTILSNIRHGSIKSIYSIYDSSAEIIEFNVLTSSNITGKTIKESGMPKGAIFAAIIKDEEQILMPRPSMKIEKGDVVIVLAIASVIKDVEKIFSAKPDFF